MLGHRSLFVQELAYDSAVRHEGGGGGGGEGKRGQSSEQEVSISAGGNEKRKAGWQLGQCALFWRKVDDNQCNINRENGLLRRQIGHGGTERCGEGCESMRCSHHIGILYGERLQLRQLFLQRVPGELMDSHSTMGRTRKTLATVGQQVAVDFTFLNNVLVCY
jgi:hypothetical protein